MFGFITRPLYAHKDFPLSPSQLLWALGPGSGPLLNSGQLKLIANFAEIEFARYRVYNGGRDSSVGIATRYGLDGPWIESRWGRYFPYPSRPAIGPTYTTGTGSVLGVKRPRRDVDHPLPFSAEVEGRVELYNCFPSEPSWPVIR